MNLSIPLFAVAYAQIDWHDFVVVETVDYQPFETGNFPPPTTPDEVGARVLMEVSFPKYKHTLNNCPAHGPIFRIYSRTGANVGRRWRY